MYYISIDEVLVLHRRVIETGYEIDATVDIQEQIILGVASGDVSRDQLVRWLEEHVSGSIDI